MKLNSGFCLKLVAGSLSSLELKYTKVFMFFTFLDEISYLLTNKKLLSEENTQRFKETAYDIKKCAQDSKLMKNCEDLCREFNINKLSKIWDGESDFLGRNDHKYEEFLNSIINDQQNFMQTKMRFKRDMWGELSTDFFSKTESVLSKQEPSHNFHNLSKKKSQNYYAGNFARNYLTIKNEFAEIGIELLEESYEPTVLYRIEDKTADFTTYQVSYDAMSGLDLLKSDYESSDDITLDMLVNNFDDVTHVDIRDEPIRNDVKDLLNSFDIGDLYHFLNDAKMDFYQRIKILPQ